ncbi:hypothetical protein [Streptomyces sp. WM6378]|uniref:hypothetical protein n=1 Tax=Streptomyces sp. WM6378 TaxID=1415557 RepID=UPI0006AE5804|nr:hypothetical protein [Streptomyces sp. WM6378]
MYRTGSLDRPAPVRAHPDGRADRTAGGLRLVAAEHRTFGAKAPAPADPFLVRLYSDMAEQYGTTFDRERLERANRTTFAEMAADLVGALPPLTHPFDLVLVASAVPDFDTRLSAASYLTEALPGDPLAFAVGEQGDAGPHTALRLAAQYARQGQGRQVLITVMDQTTVPSDPLPPRQGEDARDSAVALLLAEDGPGAPLSVRQESALGADGARALLAEALAGPLSGSAAPAVILGPGFDARRDLPAGFSGEVLIPSPEFPCTGAWAVLTEQLPRWTGSGGRVVVADYEPEVGQLSLSTADFTLAAAPVAAA